MLTTHVISNKATSSFLPHYLEKGIEANIPRKQQSPVGLAASWINTDSCGVTRWADLGPFQHGWVGTTCPPSWLLFLLKAQRAESCLAGGERSHYHVHPIRESPRHTDLISLQELLMVAKFYPRSAYSFIQEIEEVTEERSGEGLPPSEFSTWGLHTDTASGAGRIRN